MKDAVIVSGVRTAIGKLGGSLQDVLVEQLASRVMRERIVDRTILRLIGKWLKAGVMEEGERIRNEVGSTPGRRNC